LFVYNGYGLVVVGICVISPTIRKLVKFYILQGSVVTQTVLGGLTVGLTKFPIRINEGALSKLNQK